MHNYLLNYIKRDRAISLMGTHKQQYVSEIALKLGITAKAAWKCLKQDIWKNVV